MTGKLNWCWVVAILVLVAVIVIAGALAFTRYSPGQHVEIFLPPAQGLEETGDEVEFEPQKININRAEAWLLEALPGIGETRAQHIVDHREQNGPFRDITEITSVEGIGRAIYEQIKDLITTDG